mmetsp:Transcript_28737/g.93874  ORF Transcript_28737/g.93874 Transcript_28737/m.93874 type:complete len:264 (+) Transcript_28737:256-1047(+)
MKPRTAAIPFEMSCCNTSIAWTSCRKYPFSSRSLASASSVGRSLAALCATTEVYSAMFSLAASAAALRSACARWSATSVCCASGSIPFPPFPIAWLKSRIPSTMDASSLSCSCFSVLLRPMNRRSPCCGKTLSSAARVSASISGSLATASSIRAFRAMNLSTMEWALLNTCASFLSVHVACIIFPSKAPTLPSRSTSSSSNAIFCARYACSTATCSFTVNSDITPLANNCAAALVAKASTRSELSSDDPSGNSAGAPIATTRT